MSGETITLARVCHACYQVFWVPLTAPTLPDYCVPCDDHLREMIDEYSRETCGEYDGLEEEEHP